MEYEIYSSGRGYARSEQLETLYETMTYRETVIQELRALSEQQIDELLLVENLNPVYEQVIEELFGKTRARLAGAGAQLGAHASNLKNRVATGASNMAQKAGAIGSNVKNLAQTAGKGIVGKANAQEFQQGQTDVSQVGNQQAQIQDPTQARNQAVLQQYAPQITKLISGTMQKLDSDLTSLGLDKATLQSLDPELAKSISYAQGWLKSILTKLGKAGI